jgi:hypothetical protein
VAFKVGDFNYRPLKGFSTKAGIWFLTSPKNHLPPSSLCQENMCFNLIISSISSSVYSPSVFKFRPGEQLEANKPSHSSSSRGS